MYIVKAHHALLKSSVRTDTKFLNRKVSTSNESNNRSDRITNFPPHYWEDQSNRLKFMENAKTQLHIKNTTDWYNIKVKDLMDIGGTSLLSKYNGSPYYLISDLYPEHDWLAWKFTQCPRGFWDNVVNQKKFVQWATNELKIKELEDWYNVSSQDILNLGGNSLVKKFNGSVYALVSSVYPEYEWLPWKFVKCPEGFMDNVNNQRKFIDWVGKQLNIKEMNDWYKVTAKDLQTYGASSLLSKYKVSPFLLLSTIYSEYDWLPWKFVNPPKYIWNEKKNVIKFMEWAKNELKITDAIGWNKVTKQDIINLGGNALFGEFKSLPRLLSFVYPEHNFKSKSAHAIKTQSTLKGMLKIMFPQQEILEEFRHPDLVNPGGAPLELDLYFPQLNLAFEYQGQQHYRFVNLFHRRPSNTLEEDQQRDFKKSVLCKEKGITLVEIPYWWDRKYESLISTVYSRRPDLFTKQPAFEPIPLSPPSETQLFASRAQNTMKNTLMTATLWEEGKDPTGWWMSEKYDGVRLYWNGTKFYTRQGTKVSVPESITNLMPPVPLDGELWTQYGLFQDAVSLCTRGDEKKWSKAVFWVFDAPSVGFKPYEERVEYLKEMKEKGSLPSFVKLVEPVECKGTEHLKEFSEGVLAKGGEGVMMREPESLYKAGRSSSLRKFKPYLDTEVKVLENSYPHGLNCQLPNGKILFVGLAENHEEAKLVKKGSVITVKHLGTNVYGTLQYPKFYRERTDVKWTDLITQ